MTKTRFRSFPSIQCSIKADFVLVFMFIKHIYIFSSWGTRWHSWLIHRAKTGSLGVLFPLVSFEFFNDTGPGIDTASNRNEYHGCFLGGKDGRCVRLTNLPPSCAVCLQIWEPQTPGTPRACLSL